jgi:hypothetical protein
MKSAVTPTKSGRVQGINFPNSRLERINCQWTDLDETDKAFWLAASSAESLRCQINWNPEYTYSETITASQAHNVGDFILNITSGNISVGSAIAISGTYHHIIRTNDSNTQLVFDRVLSANVASGEAFSVYNINGKGEYLIEWPETINLTPLHSSQLQDYSGFEISFVRKYV